MQPHENSPLADYSQTHHVDSRILQGACCSSGLGSHHPLAKKEKSVISILFLITIPIHCQANW